MTNALDTLRHALSGDGATARYYKQQTNWVQFHAEHEAERDALARVEAVIEAARESAQPLMDDRFRDRLLRHALSNEEIRQFVDALERDQRRLAAALAALDEGEES